MRRKYDVDGPDFEMEQRIVRAIREEANEARKVVRFEAEQTRKTIASEADKTRDKIDETCRKVALLAAATGAIVLFANRKRPVIITPVK